MQIPLEIDFRNLERSPALGARTRKLAAQLERFSPRINRCHVTLEALHRLHHQGKLVDTIPRVTVPDHQIAIRHARIADNAHENPYGALRDAFKAARRKLRDYEREGRGDLRTHAEPPQGRICELDREQGFGCIETGDDRLTYFHRNSVLGRPLEELSLGVTVRFVGEAGDLGPQASTVHA